MSKFIVRKAAVLGAGVMGAQIAAHLANADVPVVLFDLPAKEGDKSGVAKKALDGLKKLKPAPLASKDKLKYVDAANYEEHLAVLGECDLVIEAIAERMDWKHDLYARIAPHLSPNAIVASNTSGLSINALAEGLPASVRPRFCGIHFFNPPRYMSLVEIIATASTDAVTLDALETWVTSRLGKYVVRALDTPNFVGNRIGVFSILSVAHHTQRFGLGFDEVDALTGPKIGRPTSATYRTIDVVGLDTVAHVIKTMQDTLPADPWHDYFKAPAWLAALIEKGALGQKSKAGIFRKVGKEIQVLDLSAQDYRASAGAVADEVAAILKIKSPAEKFAALRASAPSPGPVPVGHLPRPVPLLRGATRERCRQCPRPRSGTPMGLWLGTGSLRNLAGRWLGRHCPGGRRRHRSRQGHEHRSAASLGDRSERCSYTRRLLVSPSQDLCSPLRASGLRAPAFSRARAGRGRSTPEQSGETLFENDGVRLWRLPAVDAGIGIVSFKSKMHTIGDEVLDGLLAAISCAEQELDGVVVWHEAPFAVGANLQQVSVGCAAGRFDLLEATVEKFQRASQALKYAQVPTVAAVQGMALGGGCEFVMHAAKRVMALESYVGLVEAGVGLIPAGGGCKEFAIRAAQWAARSATPTSVMGFLEPVFQSVAMAKVSASAQEAVEMGFARDTDSIVFNPQELLYVAIREARAMADAGYAPPHEGARHPGGRPYRHRHPGDDAGEHEGRRHDLRP